MHEDLVISDQRPHASGIDGGTAEIVPPIVIPADQLEPIRDRWMRPLVERIAALERGIGRIEAQRDHLSETVNAVVGERSQALNALQAVTAERDRMQAERDGLLRTQAHLRDQIKALELRVRSAQDTTALRAIDAYDLPRQRSLRRRQRDRHGWGRWAFWRQQRRW